MKRLLGKTLLFLVSILFVLLILEFGLRVVPVYNAPNPQIVEPDSYIGAIHKKNLDVEILAEDKARRVRLVTNSYGFVGNDWSLQKATGTIRIAHHGDSMTAATDVFYEDNYVSVIDRQLREKTETPIENLNFGVGKQGTDDSLRTYEYYSRLGDPDIVVLWVYLNNDFSDNFLDWLAMSEAEVVERQDKSTSTDQQLEQTESFDVAKDRQDGRTLSQKIMQESELVQLLFRAKNNSLIVQKFVSFVKNIPGVKRFAYDSLLGEPTQEFTIIHTLQNEERNKKAVELTKEYLTDFRDMVLADGKDFFVFVLPGQIQIDEESTAEVLEQYPTLPELGFDKDRARRTMLGLLEELQISYYDLTPLFEKGCAGDTECQLYNCQYCHLSPFGHALVGEEASQILFKEFFDVNDEENLKDNVLQGVE